MSRVKTDKPLVPELRFPEFEGEWHQLDLNRVCRMKAGNFVKAAEIKEHRTENLYPCYGGNGIRGYTTTYTHDGKFPMIGRQGAHCGNIQMGNNRFHATEHAVVADPKQNISGIWLFYALIKLELNRLAIGQAQPGLSVTVLKKVPVSTPTLPEQQKIADCLGSLDELIAAHRAKRDALQDHKKGLLQQLFPAEGETTPKLRFSEFEKTGHWTEVRLNKLGKLIAGLTYKPADIRESGLLVLRSSNVQQGRISLEDCVYVDADKYSANITRPNDILICVRNGSKKLIGKNTLVPENMPHCTHGAFMTVFRSPTPIFVSHLFETPSYKKQVAADLGATINSINGRQFLKYKFYIPPTLPEQQKIASCLSSLDALITAESDTIAALQQHKKGLMQQLFPNPELG